ncbi:DUF4230 domain-containing protein [Streptomyces sudanensis]|uniref:DUF4230 domain-containing protein n=1 Tax=Streptomyces sudanensis TaxID=436397 RepID=UPI0020CF9515|nr:DUF4230 domain-containing protein [Streptomyces sudanensis]MCP9960139.1 DUF4230 domain-containing protein [Streptomyces sudanensis]MCP9989141.1 DUF4230 domain-containing protein [Streptomyces sudanensis]
METSDEKLPRARAARSGTPWWFAVPAVLLALTVLVAVAGRFGVVPGWAGLFGEETRDRSGPALLQSIQDLSRYEGAAGSYQIVVDLEKDARFLPDAIRGTRTLYVAAGTVGAYVDLGKTGPRDVTVNEERTSAVIRLPRAVLDRPALDPDRSYAVSKQRGLLDRLGDLFSDNPNDERAVQRLAAQRIGEAAKESGLTERAERNTTAMLKGLLGSLGFTQVTVVYT